MVRPLVFCAALLVWLPEVTMLPLPIAFYVASVVEALFGWTRYVDVVFHVSIAVLVLLAAEIPAFMIEFVMPRQHPVGCFQKLITIIPRPVLLCLLAAAYIAFGFIIYDGPYGRDDDIIGLGFFVLRTPIFLINMLVIAIPLRFIERRSRGPDLSPRSVLLLRSFSAKVDGVLFRSIPRALSREFTVYFLLPPTAHFPSTVLSSLPSLSARFGRMLRGKLSPMVSTDQEWAHFIRKRIHMASIIIVDLSVLTDGLANELSMLAEEGALGKTLFIASNERKKRDIWSIPTNIWMSYQTTRWPRLGPLTCDLVSPALLAAYIVENLPVNPWNWVAGALVFLVFVAYYGTSSRIIERDVRVLRNRIQSECA